MNEAGREIATGPIRNGTRSAAAIALAIGLAIAPACLRRRFGAEVLRVPAGGITAEATGPAGAAVTFDVAAEDPTLGRLAVQCSPASGSPFPLDRETTVSCQVDDPRARSDARTFVVRVRDTTPPRLCRLLDLGGPSPDPAGAEVKFKTCAEDLVDGSVGVSCNHPSGWFFPMGTTLVTCSAVDRHGNRSPTGRFTVSVRGIDSPWPPPIPH